MDIDIINSYESATIYPICLKNPFSLYHLAQILGCHNYRKYYYSILNIYTSIYLS